MAKQDDAGPGSASVPGEWSNSSVLRFSAGRDPLEAAQTAARDLVAASVEHGVAGPPVDPFSLARLLGLHLQPSNDVRDAEIYAVGEQRPSHASGRSADAPLARMITSPIHLAVAYNPSRPRGRLRFSVAHEIAHALFPDVHEAVRRRTPTGAIPPEERDATSLHGVPADVPGGAGPDNGWELELLCNVIASEMLVPVQAVEGLSQTEMDIDFFMDVRRRWDVSTETLLRRIVETSERPTVLVALSPAPPRAESLKVEYVLGRNPARASLAVVRGDRMPRASVFGRCSAVGQTVRGEVHLASGHFDVQAVGVPGYPGSVLPRVLGLVTPHRARDASQPSVTHHLGDLLALDDAGEPLVIAHVVNDTARAWGRRGFAAALARRFPLAASAFHAWSVSSPDHLQLGNAHVSEQRYGQRSLYIVSLVAQEGFGPGALNRLSNDALRSSLAVAARVAQEAHASVLVPRIGAGQAGGRWDLVEKDLTDQVVAQGVPVIVYTLPNSSPGR